MADAVRATRARVLLLALAGLAVLAGLGVVTRTLLAEAGTAPLVAHDQLCAQYDVLMGHLGSDAAFATQAGNHAARRLSAVAQDHPQPDVRQAGEDISTVTDSVAWEVSDLVTATRPIALECGWDWPVGTTPPAATPRPPAS